MSAPTKETQLEEFADGLGMTDAEMIQFCIDVLEDHGYKVSANEDSDDDKDLSEYERFRRDMAAAGIETKEYRGRFFWKGPAVYTDENNGPTRQDVMRATLVPLQWDNLGLHWVVYPQAKEDSWS